MNAGDTSCIVKPSVAPNSRHMYSLVTGGSASNQALGPSVRVATRGGIVPAAACSPFPPGR